MTLEQLERRVHLLTRYAIGLTVVVIGVTLTAAGPVATSWFDHVGAAVVEADTIRAGVVVTERLDVVEPDGRLALLAANSVQMPGVVLDGDTMTTRRGAAGLLFFYQGSEVGGLTYRVSDDPSMPAAFGHLGLDQYRNDQVAVMQYEGQGPKQRTGFYVTDRSTSFDIYAFKAFRDSVTAAPEAERGEILARFRARSEAGAFGGRRVALESNQRVAALRLSDWRSQERLRAVVDSSGSARIEFLDAEGTVVRTITAHE